MITKVSTFRKKCSDNVESGLTNKNSLLWASHLPISKNSTTGLLSQLLALEMVMTTMKLEVRRKPKAKRKKERKKKAKRPKRAERKIKMIRMKSLRLDLLKLSPSLKSNKRSTLTTGRIEMRPKTTSKNMMSRWLRWKSCQSWRTSIRKT